MIRRRFESFPVLLSTSFWPVFILGLVLGPVALANASDPRLADYFGFDQTRVMVVDPGFDPVIIADLNQDGRNDIVVANNRKSRIELLYQLAPGESSELDASDLDVNELRPIEGFRREELPVAHRVTALAVHDFDGNSWPDIIYAGQPSSIVMMSQVSQGAFEVVHTTRARELAAHRDGFFVTNLRDDLRPELAVLMDNTINVYPIENDSLGSPHTLAVGRDVAAFRCEDFNGDGMTDLMSVLPDSTTPLRLRLQVRIDANTTDLGPEQRFEMPPIREFEPVRVAGQPGALLAAIERTTGRLVVSRVKPNLAGDSGNRSASLSVFALPDGAGGLDQVAVADVNNDGLADVVATDSEGNRVLVFEQERGRGLLQPRRDPSLAEPNSLAVGNVDDDPEAELFVLSKEESIVGRSDLRRDGRGFSFPSPLPTSGDLAVIGLMGEGQRAAVAVLSKDRRNYELRILPISGDPIDVDLGTLSRAPETILGCDADQDGMTDILLLTPGSPLIMVRQTGAQKDGAAWTGAFEVMTEDDMGQVGLVQAASRANTVIRDVNGDGAPELLLANRNFVRALRYVVAPTDGSSPGWQVVEQFNMPDGRSNLTSLATVGDRVAVADAANRQIVLLQRDGGAWVKSEAVTIEGFGINAMVGGSFSGDGRDSVLCIGPEGFAIVGFDGTGYHLDEVASWRNDDEDRVEHEISSGDVNGDGFADLVVLDAGEQMLEILTLSKSERLLFATEFEVFQSKLFSGGEAREYEPRDVHIGDLNSDGFDDMLVLVHDRMLLYTQSRQDP